MVIYRMKNPIYLLVAALLVANLPLALLSSAHAADIYGTISLKGTPPPEVDIAPLKNDPNCGPLHQEMPTTHFYVVGPGGGLGDVVVAPKGFHGKSSGATASPLIIEQKGCEYLPYIAACQTGQKIVVKNLDPVLHNVHTTPDVKGNQEENRAQLPHGPDLTFSFNAPEEFLRFKCDVHPWMFAYLSVFDHPYFSVSAKDGTYRIHNVPPGHYTVRATHRKEGTLEQAVDVRDSDVKLDFTFEQKHAS